MGKRIQTQGINQDKKLNCKKTKKKNSDLKAKVLIVHERLVRLPTKAYT